MFPSALRSLSNTITSGQLSEQLLLVLLLMLVIDHIDHEEHDQPACHFSLEATIASGRYISRLLPWNSAFSLTVNSERSTRSHRVNFHVAFGEPAAVSRGACSNPTTKCTASSRTLFVDFFGSK